MSKPQNLFFHDQRCLIIGEVAQSHDGSLGMAHAYIDAIANAGADAVKFQTHMADAESTLLEPWRIRFSFQDDTRYDYWKRMEFSEAQWIGLKQHAEDKGLFFLSSPFSLEAVDILSRIGVWAWKVASGEINFEIMFEAMADGGQPFILSTGMSTIAEIDAAVKKVKALGRDLTLLQCTTEYPCPPERVGLNMINFFKERYRCKVGLSDHSGTIFPGLAAVSLGADMVEVHVTLSREMFGPDVSCSITTTELKKLVEGIRFIEKIISHPVDKDELANEKTELRRMFGKSIVVTTDLPIGTILIPSHLSFKKPGMGLGPDMFKELLGRKLKRSVRKNTFLSKEDYE